MNHPNSFGRRCAPYAVAAVVVLTCFTLADQVGPLHTFQAGEVASSAAVNENFEAIRNVINGNLDGQNLRFGSIGSTQLAPGSVGSDELVDSIALGESGGGGRLAVLSSVSDEKIIIEPTSCGGQPGGSMWVRQRGAGDDDTAVYIGVPGGSGSSCGDGGLVSVSNESGATVVQLQASGNIYKTGNNGFVHPHPADPTRQIVYMSLEGPERGTYCRGTARLDSGTAVIVPPDSWRLVSSSIGMTVQLTPRGSCETLYVEEVSRERVVVREARGGASDVEFDYLINGLREGFEDHQVYEPNTMFLPTKERWFEDIRRGVAPALIRNGILQPDGTVNQALVESIRGQNEAHVLVPRAPRPEGDR